MITKRKVVSGMGLAVFLTAAGTAGAQERSAERTVVERAALDYLEGFYEGDEGKIRRGVHPEVVKYGFWIPEGRGAYVGVSMSFEQMLAYVRRVRERGDFPPSDAPKEVRILDIQDQTAAARVTAWWGSDYLHLARYDGAWKVIHVLWQAPPPE